MEVQFMKATRTFFSICANLGLLAGAITPSLAIPPEQKSSSDRPQEEKKASQEQLKASKKREFKQGPCAFPFMENCITGPYLSASFAVGSSEASGSSSSKNEYSFPAKGNIGVNSTYRIGISNELIYGTDVGLGYDFGGLRAELAYNYSATSSSSGTITGDSLYIVDDGCLRRTFLFASSTKSDSLNYTSQRIIASLAIDIPTGSRLSPYLAGGIGPAWISIKSSNINTIDPCIPDGLSCPATISTTGGTAIALALQAKAGLAYFISPRSSLFIEAVYDYTSSLGIGNTELDDFAQYSAKFGLRYKL